MPSGSRRGREARSGANAPVARRDAPGCADALMESPPVAVPKGDQQGDQQGDPTANRQDDRRQDDRRQDDQQDDQMGGRLAGLRAGREDGPWAPARSAAARLAHESGSGPVRPPSGGLGPPAGRADQ